MDPLAGGSANDYDYCSGDPVNCSDVSGLHHERDAVYIIEDAHGTPIYVGKSKDPASRWYPKALRERFGEDAQLKVYADNLSKEEMAGLEQYLYNAFPGLQNTNAPISEKNKNGDKYLRAAERWLARNKDQYLRITAGQNGTNTPLGSLD